MENFVEGFVIACSCLGYPLTWKELAYILVDKFELRDENDIPYHIKGLYESLMK